MTRQQRAADELHGASQALASIGSLVSEGRERFESSVEDAPKLARDVTGTLAAIG